MARVVIRGWKALLVFAAVGCGGAYGELPEDEQARFQRCRPLLEPAQCAADYDSTHRYACMRGLRDDYASQVSEIERSRWLASRGCAADVANGATRSAGGTAPLPVESTAGVPASATGAGAVRIHHNAERNEDALLVSIPVAAGLELLAIGYPHSDAARVVLGVTAISPTAHLAACHNVDLAMDGRQVSLPSPDYALEPIGQSSMEHASARVDFALVDQLARAIAARGRVCQQTFDLTDAQLATLRAFVRQWRQLSGAMDFATAPDAGR